MTKKNTFETVYGIVIFMKKNYALLLAEMMCHISLSHDMSVFQRTKSQIYP